jgi:rSAM/selenodomain-associated transferase 1
MNFNKVNRDCRTIIFQKNHVLGQAKTRIVKETGAHLAFDIFGKLIQKTQMLFKESHFNPVLYYSDYIDTNDSWIFTNCDKRVQKQQADLGDRMIAAIYDELQLYDKIIIIGADCPYLDKSHIQAAFDALQSKDFVIGPTKDGGFYLLGLKFLFEGIFREITWSTNSVCKNLIRNMEVSNYTFQLIEELEDVDYLIDWKRYQSLLLKD